METAPAPRSRAWKRRILAGILTIISPGLGQFYNGQFVLASALAATALALLMYMRSPLAVATGGLGFLVATAAAFALMAGAAVQAMLHAEKREARSSLQNWPFYLLYALVYVAFSGVISTLGTTKTFRIPNESMLPTILNGDRIVTDLTAFRRQPPAPGDLAIFLFPKDETITYVKRVVGVPGDRIEFRGRDLLRNGQKVETRRPPGEPPVEGLALFEEKIGDVAYRIALSSNQVSGVDIPESKVPPSRYYMLGDNRDRSSDSRHWGFVKDDELIGRPRYVWFSWDPERRRVRWERIGLKLE